MLFDTRVVQRTAWLYFVSAIEKQSQDNISSFRHALECDRVIDKLRRNAEGLDSEPSDDPLAMPRPARPRGQRFWLFPNR